jgi:hypothetical protein
MEKIIVELEAKTNKALKGIDEVAKSVEDLNKEVVSSNKATEKSLKGVESASKDAAGGIKAIGTTLKAIGIGLIISALGTLKEMFSQNQKAVDLFNTVFETASIVVGEVVSAFTNIYDALTQSTDQFDAFGKVVKGALDYVFAPLKLTFYAIKLALQAAQLAWEESFFGDGDPTRIKELNANIQETKNSMKEVAVAAIDGVKAVVNNIGEAISEVGAAGSTVIEELGKVSVTAAYDTAKANVELQKSAELAAARQGLIFETFDRQAEKLRQIRDDETKSIAERKKANDELLVKISDAEKGMLAQAKMQLAVANADLKRDKNNVESQVAKIEAEKELAAVRAQIEGIRSEQMSNANALNKEELELTNAKIESESKLSIEKKRFNAEQIKDELLKLEKLKEIDKEEKDIETLRLQAIVDNANAGTQAKIDAEIALKEFEEQSRQTEIERKAEIDAAQKEKDIKNYDALVENYKKGLALDKQKIKDKEMVVDAISQFADAESGIGKALLIVKQGLALQETIMDLKRITFKGVEAIGSAGVSTAQNVAESSKIGFPQNLITIASAIAQGVGIVKSVKKAVSKTKAKSGGAGASVPSISTPSMPSLPPAFNVVGASDTSQLADAIGSQSQEPTRAYVVSADVTTSQEMDRNTIEGASI